MDEVSETADGSSPSDGGASDTSDDTLLRVVKFWHGVAVQATKEDYSQDGQEPEEVGPCYSSRISAMVHVAMYDAYVGITEEGSTYYTYDQQPPAVDTTGAWQLLLRLHMMDALSRVRSVLRHRAVQAALCITY